MRILEKTFFTIVTMLLVFVLGFLSFPIAIVGAGYAAYSYVSVDKLEELGILNIDTSELFDVTADVSLTSLTIQGVVNEISLLSAMGSTVTIDFLIDRYGINLDEEKLAYIPDDLRTLPLTLVFSNAGVDAVLESVEVSYVLQFLPDGVISEPAKEQLGDNTLKDVVSLNLGYLLEDVCIGYLLGVNYELVDGEYRVIYANPAYPTMLELLAPVDLGAVLTAFSSGEDVVGVLLEDVGDVMLISMVKSMMGENTYILPGLLGDRTLDDVIDKDEATGKSVLNIGALFEDRLLGDLLGYTPIYRNDVLIGWSNSESGYVVGLMRGLANVSVDGLLDAGFNYEEMLSDIYVGDVLEFAPVYDEDGVLVHWQDANGVPVDDIREQLAFKKIGELSNGGFDIDDLLEENPTIGKLLGYTYDKESGTWLDGNGVPLSGVSSVLADMTIKDLSDSNKLTTRVKSLKVADLLGYSNADGVWVDAEGNPVTGIMALLADAQIGNVGTAVNDMQIGAIMGYTYDISRGKWYKGEEPLAGVMAAFADLAISDLSDSNKFTERLSMVTLADALGYKREGDAWVDAGGNPVTGIMAVLADTPIGDVGSKVSNVQIGSVMGYEFDEKDGKWYKGEDELTGVMTAFADLTINEMSNSSVVSSKIQSIRLADALGYTKEGDVWLDAGGTPVGGVMAALADTEVGQVGARMDDMQIGSVMGYEFDDKDGKWYKDGNELTGVMTAFADLSINEMTNPALVTEKMAHMLDTMSMGELQENGLIKLDQSTVDILDATAVGWRDQTINKFVPFLLNRPVSGN